MFGPARNIICKCGGVANVAALTNRDRSSVHRWCYPRRRGGTDGWIPAQVANELLNKGQQYGLTAEDFFILQSNPETDLLDSP